MKNKHFKVIAQLFTFLKTTLKDMYKQKKGFSYLSKLEAGALVKTFLFHKSNLALFSSYFSQEKKTQFIRKISDLIRIRIFFLLPINHFTSNSD